MQHLIVLEDNHDLNLLAASQRPALKRALRDGMLTEQRRLRGTHSRDSCTKNIILAHISRNATGFDIAEETTRREIAQIARSDIELTIAGRINCRRPSGTVFKAIAAMKKSLNHC